MKARVHQLLRHLGYTVSRNEAPAPLTDSPDPIEASVRDWEIIRTVAEYTMTPPVRTWALIQAVRHVIARRVPGDFVECGVWRGGSVMAIAMILSDLGIHDRRIWLYDTFEGMTQPLDLDYVIGTQLSAEQLMEDTSVADGRNVWAFASRNDVESNLSRTGLAHEQFVFVQGDVLVTLQEQSPAEVCLLRLDTDWYASTAAELAHLYPRLANGGVCIIDDYGCWNGALQATDEFLSTLDPMPFVHRIDRESRLWFKS